MDNWFSGVLITLIAVCVLGFGFALGKDSTSTDCQDFSAFVHKGKRYICIVDKEAK